MAKLLNCITKVFTKGIFVLLFFFLLSCVNGHCELLPSFLQALLLYLLEGWSNAINIIPGHLSLTYSSSKITVMDKPARSTMISMMAGIFPHRDGFKNSTLSLASCEGTFMTKAFIYIVLVVIVTIQHLHRVQ